jgi:predicted TIM-barrel fold metal-dependent hydrolase
VPSSAASVDYWYVDADSHYYEPDDAFTRHVAPRFRDLAVRMVRPDGGGVGRPHIGPAPLRFLSRFLSDSTGRPGAMAEYMSGTMTREDALAAVIDPHDHPEYFERDVRLTVMDDQHVQAALMFPTLGVCVEPQLREHGPEVLAANLCAFNRWLEDDWGYSYQDRLFAVPLLSLFHYDVALDELDRVITAGAKAIHMYSMPVGDRSPFDPAFDAFWARVNETGTIVVLHGCDSGYQRLMPDWSEDPEANADGGYSALQQYMFFIERPVSDMLAAMLLHNLFGRFPNISAAVIENGSSWVAPLLDRVDKCWKRAKRGPWLGGVPERPSDVFRRHVYIAPFAEEDVVALVSSVGTERVMLGSDFPHPEGLAAPRDYLSLVDALGSEVTRRFMRENAATLLRIT